jgi:hypothetical protein
MKRSNTKWINNNRFKNAEHSLSVGGERITPIKELITG